MLNKDRVAVLIGKNGQTKQMIETLTNTTIEIDSKTGSFKILPNLPAAEKKEEIIEKLEDHFDDEVNLDINIKDPTLSVWITSKIIEAINIGFKPEKAIKLLDQEFSLEILNLEKTIGNSEKQLKRLKGRLIGEQGKMRNAIERYAGVHVSIYKDLVAIIGDFESLKIARKSISMILEGLPHNVVYNFLQKKYRERKDQEFKESWKPTFDY